MKLLGNLHMMTCTGKDIATEFIEKAHLNSIDTIIVNDRKNKIKQYTTAQEINKSKEYITKRIKYFLAPLYDEISLQFPEIFLNDKNKNEENIICYNIFIKISKTY